MAKQTVCDAATSSCSAPLGLLSTVSVASIEVRSSPRRSFTGQRGTHGVSTDDQPSVCGVPVNAEQSCRLALAFARETARSSTARLCAACIEVLDVTGAGITIMGGDQAGPICVSDSSIAALEDLQYTIGEGPCRDAFRSGLSVHAPRIDEVAWARWPSFVDLARRAGSAPLSPIHCRAWRQDRRADPVPAHGGSAQRRAAG